MYNCHSHTFTELSVPDKFLPLGLAKILRTRVGYYIIVNGLKHFIPFTEKDAVERYAKFVEIGCLDSQEEIFKLMKSAYPDGCKFVVLAMNMQEMGAGKTKEEYKSQIEELGRLSFKYPEILPFIHVDPRSKDYYDLFLQAIEVYGYKGIKIYPNIGCLPFDNRLLKVYDYCNRNNLNIMCHCSPYNPVYYRGTKNDFKKALQGSIFYNTIDFNQSKRKLSAYFSNPYNYRELLTHYTKSNWNLCHFGSEYWWKEYLKSGKVDNVDENWYCIIRMLLSIYPNLYSDISFTSHDKEFFPIIKELLTDKRIKEKVLFGSDYYMNSVKKKEIDYFKDLRQGIGEINFYQISEINPTNYFKFI
jgi:predicted TIM-barrel fold metal-dependent hydrolase